MKKCKICGRELENEMFYANYKMKDGRDSCCKECRKKKNKEKYLAKKSLESTTIQHNDLIKVYSNPELAKFTPRQLMQELKARGFKWEYMLEPQRKVMYDKI